MKAYEECLSATSTSDAPWYVVPADDKENARLIVSQIVLDTFEDSRWHIQRRPPSAARNCWRSASSSRSEAIYPVEPEYNVDARVAGERQC